MKLGKCNMFTFCRIKEGIAKENLGIIVQYKVKVKLILGGLSGLVCLNFTQEMCQ